MQQKAGTLIWCSVLIAKIASMAKNTLKTAPTGEEDIPTIAEDTTITTEGNGIFICASGSSQGAEESTTATAAFNFYYTDRTELTKGSITNNNPIRGQLKLSRIFDLEPLSEKGYDSDGASGPWYNCRTLALNVFIFLSPRKKQIM